MGLLESQTLDKQCEIAVDIIIEASNMIDRDYENMIKEISTFNPRDYKRWYDKNPSVHLAVESLRDLTEAQRNQLIHKFSATILSGNESSIE